MPFMGAGLGLVQGLAQQQEAEQQAETARINAQIATDSAKRDELALKINQKQILSDTLGAMEEEELLGDLSADKTVATMGASGIVIEGGFLDVLRNESIKTQMKINTAGKKGRNRYADVSNKAAMSIHNHTINALNYNRQADAFENQADTALFSSLLGAGAGYTSFGGSFS